MYRLLVKLVHAFRRLPPTAQAALAAAGMLAALHPKSREAMRKGWNSLKSSKAVLDLCDTLVDLGVQAAEAEEKARSNFERLQAVLPARQKRPLVQHARTVCTATRSALTLGELERRIRRGGYGSRSRTFRQYLRRVLSRDESFVEAAPGRWTIRTLPDRA
jgi:Asp-tRNA(Asn)/Glu-tRNA(Gln) amidotransferase A subunit family amidase